MLWRDHGRASIDRERAAVTALARTDPDVQNTWEWSFRLANGLVQERYNDVPSVDLSAIKRSYQRVCHGLANDGLYYRPAAEFQTRYLHALLNVRKIMEAQIKRSSEKVDTAGATRSIQTGAA